MSGRRARNLRRAARIAIQAPTPEDKQQALNALEMTRATYKEVRRGAHKAVKKLLRTAEQMKASETPLLVPRVEKL